jgi:hypothetical protein
LDGETVILLVGGTDGASIIPAAFEILLVRWPRLCFKMVLMVEELWYVERAAGIGAGYTHSVFMKNSMQFLRLEDGWRIAWGLQMI